MRFAQTLSVLGILFAAAAIAVPAQDKPLLGFSDEQAADQLQLEARFDSHLQRDNLRDWMERLAARPHHAGSEYGKENAEFIASLFGSWGYDTKIEVFHILFPTPKSRLLEMIEPSQFQAVLQEPTLEEDSTSGQKDEQLPTYNAYSADGDVTGELVYVNYGVPDDYEELERRGDRRRGKDRPGSLRRVLAGHQGESRRRKGCHRLPPVFRSSRGRVLPGRRLPARGLQKRNRRSARLLDGYAALYRRPAYAERGRNARG